MKILMMVDINRFVVDDKYAKMYEPQSAEEYEDLLSDICRLGRILVPIIVEDRGDGKLVILSGHYRIKAARECGQTVVWEVHVVETAQEKVAALLDNATRRQMTSTARREIIAREKTMLEEQIKESLLPEAWKAHQEGLLDHDSVRLLAGLGIETQKKIFLEGFCCKPKVEATRVAGDTAELKRLPGAMEEVKAEISGLREREEDLKRLLAEKDVEIQANEEMVKTLSEKLTRQRASLASELCKPEDEELHEGAEGPKDDYNRENNTIRELSRKLHETTQQLEAEREERQALLRAQYAIGAKYNVTTGILANMMDRQNRFIEIHRKPELLLARLTGMMLDAEALRNTLDVAPFEKSTVITMEEKVDTLIATLRLAIQRAHENEVEDIKKEMDTLSQETTEQAKALSRPRKRRTNGGQIELQEDAERFTGAADEE